MAIGIKISNNTFLESTLSACDLQAGLIFLKTLLEMSQIGFINFSAKFKIINPNNHLQVAIGIQEKLQKIC